MKIKLIPENCPAEAIEEARRIMQLTDDDERMFEAEELLDKYGESAGYDALYYACADRDVQLKDQEQYFHDLLFNDERPYYIRRMVGVEV